jgi:putative flippase GtrA
MRQFIRFGFVGLLNTGIHFGIAFLCIKGFYLENHLIIIRPTTANGVAFLMATIFSYFMNTLWSFSSKINYKNLVRYVSIAFLGLIFTVVLAVIGETIGLSSMEGVVLIICTMPFLNFGMHKWWTYQR